MFRVPIRTWQRTRAALLGAAALYLAAGCAAGQFARTGGNLARGAVDSLLGFPAISVVVGASDMLDAGNENAHEQRVEELNSAYAEFVNERHGPDPGSPDPASSVISRSNVPADLRSAALDSDPAMLD